MRPLGWTLKQLLVVLAIVAALVALLFPVVQLVRYRVLEAKCRANLWAIYTKYKLLKIQNGGRWDVETAKEFRRWLLSPEGLKVISCPLSGEPYHIPPIRLAYDDANLKDPYLLSTIETPDYSISTYIREDLVAECSCHTRPPRPRCGVPTVGGACQLCVLDVGDGKIEYTFITYTKNNRTNQRIWPTPGLQCPDPKLFPDVSQGY